MLLIKKINCFTEGCSIGLKPVAVSRLNNIERFSQVDGVPLEIHGQHDGLGQVSRHLGPQLGDGPVEQEAFVHDLGEQIVRLVERVLRVKQDFYNVDPLRR